jgi:inner membrane protein
MLARTHQAIGITSGLGYYFIVSNPVYGPATFAAVVISSSIGSLLPDLDQPTGKIWDAIPYIGHAVGKASAPFFKHRSLLHSFVGLIVFGWLVSKLLSYFPSYWGINTHIVSIAFIISYASHLISDMFTVEGIPLFFPYNKMIGLPPKPFDGARIMTGKWFENIVIFPIINIILLVIILTHLEQIKLILFK